MKRHHDKKKIEIGSEDKNSEIRHEIELRNDDKEIIHSVIPLVDENDMKKDVI